MSLVHMVLTTAPAGDERMTSVLDGLVAVAREIGAVHAHAGPNRAPREFAGDVGLGFVAVFADDAMLERYNDHPRHRTLAAELGRTGASVTVVDLGD